MGPHPERDHGPAMHKTWNRWAAHHQSNGATGIMGQTVIA